MYYVRVGLHGPRWLYVLVMPPRGVRASFNPQSTCHGPWPGPKLAYWVRVGSLCATESRARGKTRDRKRKKYRWVKTTHLYFVVCASSMQQVADQKESERHYQMQLEPVGCKVTGHDAVILIR